MALVAVAVSLDIPGRWVGAHKAGHGAISWLYDAGFEVTLLLGRLVAWKRPGIDKSGVAHLVRHAFEECGASTKEQDDEDWGHESRHRRTAHRYSSL